MASVDIYSWRAFAILEGPPKDISARLVEQGFEVVANTPEQCEKFQLAEQARWKNVIEAGKITVD